MPTTTASSEVKRLEELALELTNDALSFEVAVISDQYVISHICGGQFRLAFGPTADEAFNQLKLQRVIARFKE
jgi:hypothetical protein